MAIYRIPFARPLLLAGAFALTACPPEASMTTETDTSGATTQAGDPSTSSAETGSPTTSEGGTTEGGTTGGGTTGGTTGADVSPELDASCLALCEKFFECQPALPYPDVQSCKLGCIDEVPGGMCLESSIAINNCLAGLECEVLTGGEWGPCEGVAEEVPEGCWESDCESLDVQVDADTCSFGYECPESGSEIFCDGDTCTCIVDDEEVGSCGASEGFCGLEGDEKADIAFECCGFEL